MGVMRALALSTDGNGRWCQLNPKVGAMACRRRSRAQRRHFGRAPYRRDELSEFGSPEKPEVMWHSRSHRRHRRACTALGTPITGGKRQLLQRNPRQIHLTPRPS